MMDLSEMIERADAGDMQADDELIRLAASGDLVAMRAILDNLLAGSPSVVMLVRCEALARMAAAIGDGHDWHRLAGVLSAGAFEFRANGADSWADFYATDALRVLRRLFDAGDGEASKLIADLAPEFPAAWAVVDQAGLELPEKAALDRAAAERVASAQLDALLASLPAATRCQRLGWWLTNEWWGAYWAARGWWWAVTDWIKERRATWGS